MRVGVNTVLSPLNVCVQKRARSKRWTGSYNPRTPLQPLPLASPVSIPAAQPCGPVPALPCVRLEVGVPLTLHSTDPSWWSVAGLHVCSSAMLLPLGVVLCVGTVGVTLCISQLSSPIFSLSYFQVEDTRVLTVTLFLTFFRTPPALHPVCPARPGDARPAPPAAEE